MRPTRTQVAIVAALLVGAAACSSTSSTTASRATTTTAAPTSTAAPKPAGPAADLSTPLTGGTGVFMGEGSPPDLSKVGYVEHEYLASGTATSYTASGALGGDGRWTLTPGDTAPYRTRVDVRMPAKASAFSGTVVVEWLNVSGGVDADPDWTSAAEEITRAGDAWVGVSAQLIGVEGGPVLVKVSGMPGADAAGKGLKAIDPARYGTLSHPGDSYSYDIFTQATRAVAAGGGLGGAKPKRVIAAGESQSAFALTSYYNGVQPLTHVFDGFLIHSRGGAALPLTGHSSDLAGALSGASTILRTDQKTPVLDVQTETDVTSILNSYAARQPDSDEFRLWEVVGTAHADAHLVGASGDWQTTPAEQ